MAVTTSRPLPRITGIALCMFVAGVALALTPRDAWAGSIMCNGAGNCYENERPCSHWYMARVLGWTCFMVPLTTSPDVVANPDGSATVVQGNRSWPVMSDAFLAMLTTYVDRDKAKAPKDELDRIRRSLEALFNTNGDKLVSERRLQAVAGDLKVRVKRERG